MDALSDDAARRLSVTRTAIAEGLALIEAVRVASGNHVSIEDDLDLSTARCSLSVAALLSLHPRLTAAAVAGHRITATVTRGGSELEVSWKPAGPLIVNSTGDGGELVSQREEDAFGRAITRGDALAALSLMRDELSQVVIVVGSPDDGASWVRTQRFLSDRLSDGRWASTLTQLIPRDGSDRAAIVLVQDAQDSLLLTPGLAVAGPQAELPTRLPARQRALTAAYRGRAAYRPRQDMFIPGELACPTSPSGVLIPLSRVLASAARAAAWYWLADEIKVEPDRVTASFSGVSSLEFELLPYGSGDPTAEIALAEWATATGEPSRVDAVQQAVTFAVRTPGDLAGAAVPVLRTARSLYELAGRGLVSEALAARRASRDSAVTAARSAASTARDVATKAVERTLTLVIAASVALFANSQKFITNGTAYVIMIALAALAAASLLVALLVDTRSGNGVLTAFDADVEAYRDTLSDDDIQTAKNLQALSSARNDLRRARRTAWLIYGAVILVVAIGGSVVVASNQAATSPSPTQSAEVSHAPRQH